MRARVCVCVLVGHVGEKRGDGEIGEIFEGPDDKL